MTSARFASDQWKAKIWRASKMISSRVCYWQTLRIVFKHKFLKPPSSVTVQSTLAGSPILHWNQVGKKRYFTFITFTNHDTHIQICFLKIHCLWSTGCKFYGLIYMKVADNVKESQKVTWKSLFDGSLLKFDGWVETYLNGNWNFEFEWRKFPLAWRRYKEKRVFALIFGIIHC